MWRRVIRVDVLITSTCYHDPDSHSARPYSRSKFLFIKPRAEERLLNPDRVADVFCVDGACIYCTRSNC